MAMDLNGTWYNELGSSRELIITDKNITGAYHTVVGDAADGYQLVGQTDNDGDISRSIGFVVLWNNSFGRSDSVTSSSGQAQIVDGVETIVRTWL